MRPALLARAGVAGLAALGVLALASLIHRELKLAVPGETMLLAPSTWRRDAPAYISARDAVADLNKFFDGFRDEGPAIIAAESRHAATRTYGHAPQARTVNSPGYDSRPGRGELDKVELDTVELDKVELDTVELGTVELDTVELVELDKVELDTVELATVLDTVLDTVVMALLVVIDMTLFFFQLSVLPDSLFHYTKRAKKSQRKALLIFPVLISPPCARITMRVSTVI